MKVPKIVPIAILAAAAAIAGGCRTTVITAPTKISVVGETSRTIDASVGDEIDVLLEVMGPGYYDSLPAVSFPSVKFLDESEALPVVPAGPREQFRFRAVSLGTAVVDFEAEAPAPPVEDTIVVK